jgi:putative ABC transport system permease protein
MISNYFKIAVRNIFKDKFYSFINILGLSIGITSCLLILLYITEELSFDKFHTDADRIYRVVVKARLGENELLEFVGTPPPMCEGFRNAIPEVEAIARLAPLAMLINHEGRFYNEDHLMYADSTFFDVFDYQLLQGNRKGSLTEPYSIVLTEEMAIKYFGTKALENGSVLGSMIKSRDDVFKITGIMENIPQNSHLRFDMLVSMSSFAEAQSPIWLKMNFLTYLKLREGVTPEDIDEKVTDIIIEKVGPQAVAYVKLPVELFQDRTAVKKTFQFIFQPISSIHLHSNMRGEIGTPGNLSYIYIFSAIAAFIIIIACINFMNLATARSSKRAMEIGVRKTLGSSKRKLVSQFMIESMLFTIIAMVIALGLTEAFRVPFSNISGKPVSLNVFEDPWILLLICSLTLIIGLLAGSYPSFYLTKYKPVDVMKGSLRSGMKSSWIRSFLVVFQFVISIGLIICTSLVYKQMTFINKKNLGFNKENVIIISNGYDLGNNMEVFKEEVMNLPEVQSASYTYSVPSEIFSSTLTKAEGDLEVDHQVFTNRADYEFLETMGMQLAAGRNFSRDFPSDSSSVLVNEAAVKVLGWSEGGVDNALGKYIEMMHGDVGSVRAKYKVIGVISDFNFESLKSEIRPVIVFLFRRAYRIAVKVNSDNIPATLNNLEAKWKSLTSDAPFEYSFLDQSFEKLYQAEQKLGQLFFIFTSMAIFIACLGLIGLAAYTAEQRTKEIGIRKIMGASVPHLFSMLNMEFIKLVVIALVISSPLAWYFMKAWLGSFVYKTEISVWPFLLAGFIAVFIAVITVGYQSIKAATANPVNSLRSE